MACVAHGATEAVGVSLTLILFSGTSDLLFTGYYGMLAWVPLGAVCAWLIWTGKLKPVKEGIVVEEKPEATPVA